MNKKYLTIILAVFVLFLAIVSVSNKNAYFQVPKDKMLVTASFYPLAFLAEEIGGDKVFVTNLTPAGAEPHDYEPTPRDMAQVEKSSVLIINGLGLEPWYDNAQKNINPKKTKMLVVGEGLNDSAIKDPHVWLSPALMKTIAERIETSFEKADPKNKNYYFENLQTLKIQLDTLDQEYKTGLASCAQKEIITSHTAFHYLAKDYGLTQISIAGLSPDSEPSPKELGNIVAFAKEHRVKYIFFESLVSPKLAEMIAREVGAKTLVLNPLEGLTEKERLSGENYLSIMRENLAHLQTALSCKQITQKI